MKKMLSKSNKRGFTLIELIVVIAILGILSGLLIPTIANYVKKANLAVAKENGSRVLAASVLLNARIENGEDLQMDAETFLAENNLKVLMGNNAIDNNVVVEVSGNEIVSIWSMKNGALAHWSKFGGWEYSDTATGTENTSDPAVEIIFNDDTDTTDYVTTGTWSAMEDSLYSNNGLLFIPNDNETYTITAVATLGDSQENGTYHGGYGILFETVIDNRNLDTGYSLQFDRGYGGIIIRRRVNGNEQNPIAVVKHGDVQTIPANTKDSWWTETHTVTLTVSKIANSNKKSLNVWIDGELMISNFTIDSPVSTSGNTGLRTWAGSVSGGAYFHSITIE